MASATTKPPRLGEFLQEKQEPFVLEVCLLERSFAEKIVAAGQERSVNCCFHHPAHSDKGSGRSASDTVKRRKGFSPYFKILKAVSKLLFVNESKTSPCKNGNLSNFKTTKVRKAVAKSAKFPFLSSTDTHFNSCPDTDQKSSTAEANRPFKAGNYGILEAIRSDHNDPEHEQERQPKGPACFHDQGISTDKGDSNLRKVKTKNRGTLTNIRQKADNRSYRHNSFSNDEKITEDMILSASLSHMLVQSVAEKGLQELRASRLSQMLKSKGILQQTQQLLLDCVREISTNVQCSYDKAQQRHTEILGPEEVGKLIFEKLEQSGNQGGDETNIKRLLTADYHNSIKEWTHLYPQKWDVGIEIGDAIFEDIHSEIFSEIIHILV